MLANAHGITLAVTDSNYNNVLFNPEMGSVHCNDEVRGAVIESLPEMELGSRFLGPMGLLVMGGQLAFFRRRCSWIIHEWETTGFVTDLQWFQDQHLSLSVVFHGEGPYRVKLTNIGSDLPPVTPTRRIDEVRTLWGADAPLLTLCVLR